MKARFLFATFLCFFAAALTSLARAQHRGVINDPDGYTNVREKPSADSATVTRVRAGEVFDFEHRGSEFATWVKVRLASGQTGYMHASRVRFHATVQSLADSTPGDEVNIYGRSRGIAYYPLARAAARGERAGMQRYFAIDDTDGAAAETHYSVFCSVVHLLGDERLAKFLEGQSRSYLANVREHLVSDMTLWPFEPKEYCKRNFPRTVKALSLP